MRNLPVGRWSSSVIKDMSALSDVAFIPLIAEAVLYGLYLPTFVHCLRWILLDDEGLDIRKEISWQMLSITIIFFILMTADIGIQFRQAVVPAAANLLAYKKLDGAAVCISSAKIYKLMFDW